MLNYPPPQGMNETGDPMFQPQNQQPIGYIAGQQPIAMAPG